MNVDIGRSANQASFSSMIFMDCVEELGDNIAEAAIQGMKSYPHNACDIAFGAILEIMRTEHEGVVKVEIEKVISAAGKYR
ncbi:MAG: hypothetical protein KBD03_05035 [Gammaproteobacteria bacterium]|nr:hypothetical protein [Gammaproteobacteria bacterium]